MNSVKRDVKDIRIENFVIGTGRPVFIIAEIGINHNGEIERAKSLIRAAKRAGAHAVKFQSFKADKICDMYLRETKDVEGLTGGSKSTFDLYKSVELSDSMHYELIKTAQEENIIFLSSVFDEQTADFLDALDMPAYKIASSDLTHLPLIKHVAEKGKPVIISTGMGTIPEIETAVDACLSVGNDQIVLLHCVSSYPPPDEEVNLKAMETMRRRFAYPIGYSDHCEGTLACVGACFMGAVVIEKHFTLDNEWQGPDHRISATADDFLNMVAQIKTVEKLIGSGVKEPADSELTARQPSRRSIRALGTIEQGQIITADNVIALKPEIGILPKDLDSLIGMRAKVAIKNHEPLTWDKLE